MKSESVNNCWLSVGVNCFVPTEHITLSKKIKSGAYEITFDKHHGGLLKQKEILSDELFDLTSKEYESIINDVKIFYKNKKSFEKYNFNYKRGILLYGPQGSGKTSLINIIAKNIINDNNGIVIFIDDGDKLYDFIELLPRIRQIEPKTQILCVLEDVDSMIRSDTIEIKLLNLLDGNSQSNNIVFIATTNFPEKLKERILNRPSRFDRRYKIDYPTPETRKFYLEKKLSKEDLDSIDIDFWVSQTKGFSIAHLGELIKSVFVLENSFEYSMKLLTEMKEMVTSNNFDNNLRTAIGFNRKSY